MIRFLAGVAAGVRPSRRRLEAEYRRLVGLESRADDGGLTVDTLRELVEAAVRIDS